MRAPCRALVFAVTVLALGACVLGSPACVREHAVRAREESVALSRALLEPIRTRFPVRPEVLATAIADANARADAHFRDALFEAAGSCPALYLELAEVFPEYYSDLARLRVA